ncbi:4Fe-4S ferredoxin [Microcoleus sp. FACHB-831]|uniref:circadian clock protein LdpA n=1 Tax=Microcoleus sp. FACHB-831 TaxID=2692827 RepID=UPI0016878F5A|nr:LdpA C-terminal domain-containing domain [Microcoleus sp. FACHB-831]MBD1921542.1 4Fe-4S ferredoxin [Microcoleus sp. FACHB-831]
MTEIYYPLKSLREGHWFKLICGASFQHLPAVRNLTLAYTLAGADCIDVAADPAVIAAAKEAIETAAHLRGDAQRRGYGVSGSPLLMVSLNDGEDPHFRKAEFNSTECPSECPRPCETICPAGAIAFSGLSEGFSGVIDALCYGCGRCVPVCPSQLIYTRSYVSVREAIAPLILQSGIDALEIHTQVGRLEDFKRLWQAIAPWSDRLKLLAISCPDGEGMIDYLWALYDLIKPLSYPLVWQTDGRPMSGDIGAGTTRAAVKLGQKVLAARLPGYVQLAGGTNNSTVEKLRAVGLLNNFGLENTCDEPLYKSPIQNPKSKIAGVAYGSYARVLMSQVLEELEKINRDIFSLGVDVQQQSSTGRLEDTPLLLWQAVELASSLVSQLKSSVNHCSN